MVLREGGVENISKKHLGSEVVNTIVSKYSLLGGGRGRLENAQIICFPIFPFARHKDSSMNFHRGAYIRQV